MKRLTTYISHTKDLHSLNEYLNESKALHQNVNIQEKLVVNKNYNPYTCAPKSRHELKEIIKDRYDKLGPGTEQNPIDFNDIDVSNIDSFNGGNLGLFSKTNFEYIDISNWNVSNVKIMNHMFFECIKLISVGDLSNWDVSNVKYINCMFACCEQLKSVGNLFNWNTSKAEKMQYMFYGCEKLESVGDLSNWNISNVENMFGMFYECKQLKSVGDLSDWDISSVEDKDYMFYGSGITNIPSWYKE